jgi:hypothetical protein
LTVGKTKDNTIEPLSEDDQNHFPETGSMPASEQASLLIKIYGGMHKAHFLKLIKKTKKAH